MTSAVQDKVASNHKVSPLRKRESRKTAILLAAGAVLFIAITATAVIVRRSGEGAGRPVTEIDLAIANRQETYRAYIERLSRADLGVDSIDNPGLIQQQYAILSQEFLRDAGILRNTPDHPYYRMTLQGTLDRFRRDTNTLLHKAEKGAGITATLIIEDGEETTKISIPSSELAAIAMGRLWSLALAENLRVAPGYNQQLSLMQVETLQDDYKKAQRNELQTLGMVDAAAQINVIEVQSEQPSWASH